MKEKQRIESLTGLKGIFIMFIVLTHTMPDTPLIRSIPLTSFIDHYAGVWGNSMFFMLSGYLLSMGYRDRILEKKIPFGSYLTRRLSKIYPMYILSNLVMIPLQIGIYGPGMVNFRRLALVGLMQAGGALDNQFPFNGPSWFVCTLMVCYLLYYLITCHSKDSTHYRCFLVLGIIAGYILMTRYLSLPYCYNENGYAYVNFFAGCMMTEIIPAIPEKANKKFALPGILVLGISGYMMLRYGVETMLGPDCIGYAFFLNPLILWLATIPGPVRNVLAWKPVAWLGTVSVSLYFWHTPLQEVFTRITGSAIFTDQIFFLYLAVLFPVCTVIYNLFRKRNLI